MACSVAKTARVIAWRLAQDVFIGPGCVIGPDVEIGRGTRLFGHICLLGGGQAGRVQHGRRVRGGSEVLLRGSPYWGTATCAWRSATTI